MDDPGPESGPPWAPGYRHLTVEVPPVAFRVRERLEDFLVEEIPLDAGGAREGTHVEMTIEKRGLSTPAAIARIARALDRRPDEVGYAGRKDARAVTRQRLSIEHVDPDAVRSLDLRDLRVLEVRRRATKLRVGELAGNRFRVVLRGLGSEDRSRVERVLAALEKSGLPNWIGEQRFGRAGRAYELGALLAAGRPREYLEALVSEAHAPPSPARAELERVLRHGTWSERRGVAALAGSLDDDLGALARQLARRPKDPASAVRAIPKQTRRFHLSALQSRVFQRVLAARMRAGAHASIEAGDLPHDHRTGRDVRVSAADLESDLETWNRRAQDLEVSPTGPLPGGSGLARFGRPGTWERAAVDAEGLDLERLARLGGVAPRGARRSLRVPVQGIEVRFDDEIAELGFVLPPGSFATSLLEELAKEHSVLR